MRWTFYDPRTQETWHTPVNPDEMSNPQPSRALTFGYGQRRRLDKVRLNERPNTTPTDWTFSGMLYTKEHYEALSQWARRGLIHITDHLDRTWVGYIVEFTPEERHPSPRYQWRMRYTIRVSIIKERR